MHEVLLAPTAAFDFDNLLLTVTGKGRKERRIPFSLELRKQLMRWQQQKDHRGPIYVALPQCAACPLRTAEDLQLPHQRLSILNRLR
jgi:site-specific recombinase XerC